MILNKYTVLECISSIQRSSTNYNREVQTFISGNIYLVHNKSNPTFVNVSNNDSNGIIFVHDSTIYDVPQFDKHFKIIDNIDLPNTVVVSLDGTQCNINTIELANNYETKKQLNERLADIAKSITIKNIGGLNFRLSVENNAYQQNSKHDIEFDNIQIKSKYITEVDWRIYKKNIKTFKLTPYVNKLKIDGFVIEQQKSKYDTKLTEYISDKFYNITDHINSDTTKKLNTLKISGCFIEKLSTIQNTKIQNSIINHLEINDKHNVKIENCIIHSCNKTFGSVNIHGEYHQHVIKISDDNFIVTGFNGAFTRLELTELTHLLGWHNIVKKFKLDIVNVTESTATKLTYRYSDKKAKPISLHYSVRENNPIEIEITPNDDILLSSDVYPCGHKPMDSNNTYYMLLTKTGDIKYIVDCYELGRIKILRKTLTDDILNRLTKATEHPLLFTEFFLDFYNEPSMAKSKLIGSIDIKDFSFKMFDDYEKIVSISLKEIDKKSATKGWYITQYHRVSRTSYSGGNRHSVMVSDKFDTLMDWGQYKFKLNVENAEPGTYFNPYYTNYTSEVFDYSNNIIIDQMYILQNPVFHRKFDDTNLYRINCTDEKLEKNGMMVLGDDVFIYSDKPNDTKYNFFKTSTINSTIKEAEKLAKKYKFKLDINNVHIHTDKYYTIYKIRKAKPESSNIDVLSPKFYMLALSCNRKNMDNGFDFSYFNEPSLCWKSLFGSALKINNEFSGIPHDMTFIANIIIKIDNTFICMLDNNLYTLSCVDNIVTYNNIKPCDVQKLLQSNDGYFSVVNFDIPDRLFDEVIDKFGKVKLLTHSNLYNTTKMFGTSGYHLRVALYAVNKIHNKQLFYHCDDKKLDDKYKTLSNKMSKKLMSYLVETLTKERFINDVTTNVLDFDKPISFLNEVYVAPEPVIDTRTPTLNGYID